MRPDRRESSTARGYNYRWKQARAAFLRANPLCACPNCQAGKLRTMAATVVDHDPPHKGDMVKFWDRTTWRPMAKACHDAKTAAQDGGFGNAKGKVKPLRVIGIDGYPVEIHA